MLIAPLVVAIAGLVSVVPATAALPTRGVVVPGQSIGSLRLGMSEAQVRRLWGGGYKTCTVCGSVTTWLYEYPGPEPLGAAVKFSPAGKVVAVFTLGSPAGWGLKGAMMGDPAANIYSMVGDAGTNTNCIGYDALTVRVGGAQTSFYSSAGVIYGYALTAASQSPCE